MSKPEEIATIVRMHRKAANLTQLRLAELAGVGKTVVYEIEKGKETVKLQTLKRIFEVLNIQLRYTSPLLDERKIDHEKS